MTAFDQDGFSIVSAVFSRAECCQIKSTLGPTIGAGRRTFDSESIVRRISTSPRMLQLVENQCGGDPFPVRVIYFNKSPSANWFVGWHQDLTIAVGERRDVPGFSSWSVKGGVTHVQPPASVLEDMVTLRLHFDDADESNGALHVLPGTHRLGRLGDGQIESLRGEIDEVICCARAGDVMLMRPLLLHSSARSECERERRVLHIEYASQDLPRGLQWHCRIE